MKGFVHPGNPAFVEEMRQLALSPHPEDAPLPLSDDPNDFCIIDTETRSRLDVTEVGAVNHIAAGRVIIVTYAIGDGPVQVWAVDSFDEADRLNFQNIPGDLQAFWRRAARGEAWFVAWNSGFDRHALGRGIDLDPTVRAEYPNGEIMRVDMIIDAMAQSVKSHLPPDLMGAAQYGGAATKKRGSGKALIKLFSDEAGTATPQTHPAEWAEFIEYAVDDIGAARDLFFSTAPLSAQEWAEFWANEYINDRGMPVDVEFVAKAAALAKHNAALADAAVREISGGALLTVNQHKAMLAWVEARIGHHPAVEHILTREVTIEEGDDGEDVAVVEKSLSRERVEALIALLEELDAGDGLTDDEYDALRMLEVRLYGASATPRKFVKIGPLLVGDRLTGQYVFNGAAATGRFSSRGAQTHNLTRDTVGTRDDEIEAIETILDMEIDP